jgi:quercetin dioxygenase-like cupin family protein
MPSTLSDTIRVGALSITYVLDAETSGGRATAFECDVPARAVMAAPHSHDGFEEINYGLTGVTTFTVDGERRELHPGGVVFIPRGAVHAFENRASGDAKFLAVTAGRVRTRVLRGGRRRARRDRRRTARPRRDRRGHAPSRPHPGIRVNA